MHPSKLTRRSQRTPGFLKRVHRRHFRFERLEDRSLLAVFTVNTLLDTVDANPGDGVALDAAGTTSLRAAVMETNALAGNDTIMLPAGTYMLTLVGDNEDDGRTGDLDVTGGSVTILGDGATETIIDAHGVADRVLHVGANANASITGAAFRGGDVVASIDSRGEGGGIYNAGTLSLTSSAVSGNSAQVRGAGIYNAPGSAATLSETMITDNHNGNSVANGSGIANSGAMTILNCVVFENSGASRGAGIYNELSGTLTIAGSTISGNSAAGAGDQVQGGGLYNRGTVSLSNSTISDNTAWGFVFGSGGGTGGGIHNESGSLTIVNSTITANESRAGGGIYNAAELTIRSSTITNNLAGIPAKSGGPGGIFNAESATLSLQNTILAANRIQTAGPPDIAGAVNSLGNNLVGNTRGFTAETTGWVSSDLLNVNPRLAPLAENGGPTMTHALLPDSPAIDAGNNAGATATDQRGNRRPRDGNGDGVATVDIGSFELSLDQSGVEAVHDAATVNEDTTGNVIDVLTNDRGPSGADLSVVAVTQPANGTAVIVSNGAGVLYTPKANFVGIDTFGYTVSDGAGSAATAMVTITVENTDTDLQGTAADDVFLVRRDVTGENVQVFGGDTPMGTPLMSMPVDSASLLLIDSLGGDDHLIIDLINGNPIPVGGAQFTGGDHGIVGDQLIVRDVGTATAMYVADAITTGSGTVTIDGRNVTLAGVEPIDVSGLNSFLVLTPNTDDKLTLSTRLAGAMELGGTTGAVALSRVGAMDVRSLIIDAATNDGVAGDDSLIVTADGVVPVGFGFVQFRSGKGKNTITINGGMAQLDATVHSDGTLNTTLMPDTQLITHRLRQTSLTLNEGGRVTILPDGTDAATSVLTSLTINPGGTLDVNDNALILDYTGTSPLEAIRAKIIEGRGGIGIGNSKWNGTGITSSVAQQMSATQPETWSIGYAENATLPLGPYSAFRGQPVDATSILIAYTKTGDVNLDGAVNDDDVTIVSALYAPGAPQPNWALGDIDYNGFVDDDDITLIGALYEPPSPPPPLAVSPPRVAAPPVAASADTVTRSAAVRADFFAAWAEDPPRRSLRTRTPTIPSFDGMTSATGLLPE